MMQMWLIEKKGQRREKTLVYEVYLTCLHWREKLWKSKRQDSYVGSNLKEFLHAMKLFLVFSILIKIIANEFLRSN